MSDVVIIVSEIILVALGFWAFSEVSLARFEDNQELRDMASTLRDIRWILSHNIEGEQIEHLARTTRLSDEQSLYVALGCTHDSLGDLDNRWKKKVDALSHIGHLELGKHFQAAISGSNNL